MSDPEIPSEMPPVTPEFQADLDQFTKGQLDEEQLVERYMERLGYGDLWRQQQRLAPGELPE
ncbi:hypothetical protein [Agrococcus jejuensis]|uniref:Uncharacterized protein n=1 Tax=Agrococcus jejuensis TaxID=399736 RepID=A0A1G8B7U3_9MICO|nr:hypothetical protein [Agrococcus jejuensis]SDH29309.1 hypothetical protein SAMN04489720_0725 [Agrococcus jejuensis]